MNVYSRISFITPPGRNEISDTEAVLQKATGHVREFSGDETFSASMVLVVTWVKLYPFDYDYWYNWYNSYSQNESFKVPVLYL